MKRHHVPAKALLFCAALYGLWWVWAYRDQIGKWAGWS